MSDTPLLLVTSTMLKITDKTTAEEAMQLEAEILRVFGK